MSGESPDWLTAAVTEARRPIGAKIGSKQVVLAGLRNFERCIDAGISQLSASVADFRKTLRIDGQDRRSESLDSRLQATLDSVNALLSSNKTNL